MKSKYIYEKVVGLSDDEEMAKDAEADYAYFVGLGKRKNMRFSYLLLSIFLGFVFSLFSFFSFFSPSRVELPVPDFLSVFLSNTDYFALIAGGVFAMYSISLFFRYLRPEVVQRAGKDIKSDYGVKILLSGYERKLASMEGKFNSIIEKLQSGGVSGEIFSKDEKAEVLNDLKLRLESSVFEEYFDKLNSAIKEGQRFKQREDIFFRTVSRLGLEIQNQSKRGNVNLLLGIFTTVCGVVVLGYSVFQAPLLTSGIEITSHFLPRISLVIVVEVFAYFFLRLYKQSLDEIKYFQNEMTNIESKYLGLYIATEAGCEEGVLNSINSLLSAERNFLLDKGQSTASIELKKIEASSNDAAMGKLSSIISDLVKLK